MTVLYKKLSRFANDQGKVGYLFVLPSLLTLAVFVIFPLIMSLVSSLYDFNITLTKIDFIGLENYRKVLANDRFQNSLWNTIYFTIVVVPAQIVLSLFVALLIKGHKRYNLFLRSVYFVPVVCSMTVISIVLVFLMNYEIGAIPTYLRKLGITPVNWLNDTVWAMPAVMAISVWKNFGFSMVIFLAALQGVPDSYYEAAELDGAGKARQFFNITLPMIMPTVGFVTITTFISSFQVFDQVFVMTNGGPLFKTETMVQYIYYRGFVASDMGFATANAFILFLITLTFTLVMFRSMRKTESGF